MSFNQIFQQQVYTWNEAYSYNTSGDALVNLFFKTVQGLTEDSLMKLLDESLNQDVLATLKIIFHARDPRGGKKWKDIFKLTFGTKWNHHQELQSQLLSNPLFWCLGAEYGSWKTVIELGMTFNPKSEEGKAFIQALGNQLLEDYKLVDTEEPISLAGKWAPSPGKSLARKNRQSYLALVEYVGYSSREEKGYRNFLTKLRNRLKIVETKMCSREWEAIEYSHVPSVAMKVYRKAFQRQDEKRFTTWVESLAKGESKVNAKLLYPHEITKALLENNRALLPNNNKTQELLIEAQWGVMVDELLKMGTLNGIIPMCDVSGSMDGTPMDVCLALGLLVSQVSTEPFKDLIITFTDTPDFHQIKGESLKERIKCFKNMRVGYSTNFQGAFRVLLARAQTYQVKPEDMPRTILVFSDCQFNQFDKGNLKTNLQGIQEQYAASGYEMPQLVFWNLNGSTPDFPSCNTPGVSLVSGFSEVLLKALMNGEPLGPMSILNSTVLHNERYNLVESLLG
jgi:hypothetical protein